MSTNRVRSYCAAKLLTQVTNAKGHIRHTRPLPKQGRPVPKVVPTLLTATHEHRAEEAALPDCLCNYPLRTLAQISSYNLTTLQTEMLEGWLESSLYHNEITRVSKESGQNTEPLQLLSL